MPPNTPVIYVSHDHAIWTSSNWGAAGSNWQGDLTISATNDFPFLTYIAYGRVSVSAASNLAIIDSDGVDVVGDWTNEYHGGAFSIWSYDKILELGLNDGDAHHWFFRWGTGKFGSHQQYFTLNLWNNANNEAGCDHMQVISNFTSSNNTASTSLASIHSAFYCITLNWTEPASNQGGGNMKWLGSSLNCPAFVDAAWGYNYGDCNVSFTYQQYQSENTVNTDVGDLLFQTTKHAWNMVRMEIYPQLAVPQAVGGILGFDPPGSEYFYVTFNDSDGFEDTR